MPDYKDYRFKWDLIRLWPYRQYLTSQSNNTDILTVNLELFKYIFPYGLGQLYTHAKQTC